MTSRVFACLMWLAALMLAPIASPASAQSFTPAQRDEIVAIVRDALKSDPTILRDAVAALTSDDSQKQEAAAHAAINAAGTELTANASDPVAGNPSGDVTIVEFFDVRCPYCKRLEPTMDKLLKQDHGVRLVYKDLPILGPASVLGTKALLAAQLQEPKVPGAYVKLRESLMLGGGDVTKDTIHAAAQHLGLDWDRLQKDMDSADIQARIDANLRLAHDLGIEGTPAMVIGKELVPGAVDFAELDDAVKKARKQP
jgi:protein-disulfide isomerase